MRNFPVHFALMAASSVKLYVYDLSGGLAKSMSMPLVGKQIDGIWYVADSNSASKKLNSNR